MMDKKPDRWKGKNVYFLIFGVKLTSCWSRTRSMSSALMCCFFPWSCRRRDDKLDKSPCNWLTKNDNNRRPCWTFFFIFFLIFLNPPCFPWTSWREWSSSSAIRTPSCEFLGKTWGHWWSVVTKTDKKRGRHETFFFFSFLQGPYRIITPWIWIKERMTKGAGHLNDDEEGLCVILRVLQNVIWVGEKKPMWINCATQSHSKQK